MASESSCWCKLTELVTYHILSNINRNKLVSVMNSDGVAYEVWGDHACT